MVARAWQDDLREALSSTPRLGMTWLAEDKRALVSFGLEQAFEAFPFGEAIQSAGLARIRRVVPLAVGPSRSPRLAEQPQRIVLAFDPEIPDEVVAVFGGNLPPFLWPSAEPTIEGLERALAPYLDPPFRSAHTYSRVLRVGRGSLEALGFASIAELCDVMVGIEWWYDGRARWSSGELDDPWPADPRAASVLELRRIEERAARERPGARPSIALRTLWSRSVLVVEETLYGDVVFEMRYEPAPFVAALPAAKGALRLPEDLPVDLLGALVRAGTLTPAHLDELLATDRDVDTMVALLELRTGEPASFEALRRMIADPALRDQGIALAIAEGARALLYELECDTDDEALRASLAERLAFRLVEAT